MEPKIAEKAWNPELEKEILKQWVNEKIYEFFPKEENFTIDTPPPYPSGRPWHIGAAAHYSQIDMIARTARMAGKNVYFPIGIDRNGLPVEIYTEKKHNIRMRETERGEFLKLCRAALDDLEAEMILIMKSLGISGDFSNYYRTDSEEYRTLTQSTFIDLWKKGQVLPHILVMTATPIPRTLAMTVYGDLDVSVIDEMPVGRKPIITVHRQESMRPAIMEFLRTEIAKGRQVYYVFPLIEDSEKLDLNSLMSGFDMVNEYLPPPQFKYSIVHGKLKAKEKESAMNLFKNHQTDILIATTVIEVGVNVPNASVMVIENAERFGLAQLHQLRGRVGRGNEQSYCVLITKPGLSENGYKRISTMARTNDGFEIAKVDLELRGPGELDGTKQSGVLELKLADIRHDESILIASRVEAQEWLGADELLSKPESEPIRNELKKIPHRTVWSKIS